MTCSDVYLKNVPLETRWTLDCNGARIFEGVHLGDLGNILGGREDGDQNLEGREKKDRLKRNFRGLRLTHYADMSLQEEHTLQLYGNHLKYNVVK